MDPEVEDERTDRFIAAGIEFDQPGFAFRDGNQGGVSGSRSAGLIIGICYIAIGIDMNIDGYFCVLIEIVRKRRHTCDMPA